MADINTGSTGAGDPPGEPRGFDLGLGSRGGFSGGSAEEIERFIRSTGRAQSKLSELQKLMRDEGKRRVSDFTDSFKKLNTQLERAEKRLGSIKEKADAIPSDVGGAGGGEGGGAQNGGDWKMPEAATEGRPLEARIPGGEATPRITGSKTAMGGAGWAAVGAAGASGIPRGPVRTASDGGGGFISRVGAGRIALGAAGGGIALAGAAGRVIESRRDAVEFLELLGAQQGAYGPGTRDSYQAITGNAFRTGNFANTQEFAGAEGALRGMGLGRGSQTHTRMLSDIGGLLHARPDADAGQLAQVAGTLQHGQVAMGLRQRGITSYDRSTPDQMRDVLRAAAGREPSVHLLNLTTPGTPMYANLLALLGGDETLVNEVLEFGRADAKGRAKGVDVTTEAGARAVFGETALGARRSREGTREARTIVDRTDELADTFQRLEERSERWGDRLESMIGPMRNFIEELGGFSSQISQMLGAGTGGLGGMTTGVIGTLVAQRLLRGRGPRGGPESGGPQSPRSPRTSPTPGGPGTPGGVSRVVGGVGRALGGLGAGAAGIFQGAKEWSDFREWQEERAHRIDEDDGWFTRFRRRNLHDWANEFFFGDEFDDDTEPTGGSGLLDGQLPVDAIRGADHEGEQYLRPSSFGGVKEHVRKVGNFVTKKFGPMPGGIGGVGQRSNKSDHPKGLALDFMTMNNTRLGDRIAKFMANNAKHFGVKYIIWRQKINKLRGKGWEQMEDRGSPTANHMDHPHVSFHESPGLAAMADSGRPDDTQRRETGVSTGFGGMSGMNSSELDVFEAFFGGLGQGGSTGEGLGDTDYGPGDDASFGSTSGIGSGRQLNDRELMAVLQQAGFRGQALATAFAVAKAESGGNAGAHNPNRATGDNSYGLFQINMLGNMGPARRQQYGLSSNQDLFDPVKNAEIAFQMSRGGTNWTPWSVHPDSRSRGGSGSGYEKHLSTATELLAGGGNVEPAGGLTSAAEVSESSGGAVPTPNSSMGGVLHGGVRDVNVTFKIERATYEEAEKFAGWVMEITQRKHDLDRVGGR